MRNDLIKCGALFALALVCGCGDNWVVMKQGDALCRVNRKTGEAYVMRGTVWVPVKEYTPPSVKPKKAQRVATSAEGRNITGRGSFSDGSFFVAVYNGNKNCVVKRVSVLVKIMDLDGNTLDGPRKYVSSANINPFDTRSVSFSVLRSPLVKREWNEVNLKYVNVSYEKFSWSIVSKEVLVEEVD